MDRRSLIKLISLAPVTPIIVSCGGGNNSEENLPADIPNSADTPNSTDNSSFFLYPNSNDPRVLSGSYETEQYILHGEKNTDGTIASIEEIYFRENDTDFVKVSAENENTAVISKGGMTGKLSKLDDGSFGFELSAGDQQLNLSFSLGENLEGRQAQESIVFHNTRSGISTASYLSYNDCNCEIQNAETQLLGRDEITVPIVEVALDGCIGENPLVKVIMRDEAGKILDVAIGTKNDSSGKSYNAIIPYHNTTDQIFAEHADHALEFFKERGITDSVLGSITSYLTGFTIGEVQNAIIDKLKSSGTETDVYEGILPSLYDDDYELPDLGDKIESDFKVGLGKFLGNIAKTVDVAGKIKTVIEAGILVDDFLDAYIQNEFSQIQLQPVLETSNGKKFVGTSSGLISPNGPFPTDLSVSAEGSTSISTLVLSPSNPGEGQEYQATGVIDCASVGDVIILSIIGTDGYSDTQENTISDISISQFNLSVPGAESGVNDRVTIKVTRSGATIIQKTASLVFG